MPASALVFSWALLFLLGCGAVAEAEPSLDLELTPEEVAWIRTRPEIRVGRVGQWPPYDFIEDGESTGLSIEYIELLANAVGVPLRFVDDSFPNLIARFKRGEIDVMPSFFKNEQREAYTLFSSSYHTLTVAILRRKKEPLPEGRDGSYHPVGIQAGSGLIPLIRRSNPEYRLVEFENSRDMIVALATDRLEGVVGNLAHYYFLSRDYEIFDLEVERYIDIPADGRGYTELHFGVRKDWPIFHGILEKAMQRNPVDELEEKWMDTRILHPIDWDPIVKAALAMAALLLFLLWHNRGLQSMVAARTRELVALNTSLEGQVAARTADLRSALDDLTVAKDRAEQANAAKNRFLAKMSHELRSPLNAILGFSQIMQDAPQTPPQQRRQAGAIHRNGGHLLALINDVLDLAQLEAERMELHPEAVEPGAFVDEVMETLRPEAERKGLGLHYRPAAGLPAWTSVDPIRLRQVLINPLTNALKFTERGQVCLTLEHAQGRLRIEIQDTGPGIPEDARAEVFEPFTQLGSSTHRATGSGLGLAITREILTRMGGRIALDSGMSGGTRVRLEIPAPVLAQAPEQGPERGLVASRILGYRRGADDRPLRLLIVDDIDDNRALLRQMLAPLGFAIDEAQSGEAGLRLAQHRRPDLVLMDLRLADLDGLAVARRMHQLPGLRSLPILIVSASASEQHRRDAREAGCIGLLAKPVDRNTLLRVLGASLDLVWRYDDAVTELPEQSAGRALEHAERALLAVMVDNGEVDRILAHLEALTQSKDCPEEAWELLALVQDLEIDELERRLTQAQPPRTD